MLGHVHSHPGPQAAHGLQAGHPRLNHHVVIAFKTAFWLIFLLILSITKGGLWKSDYNYGVCLFLLLLYRVLPYTFLNFVIRHASIEIVISY